MSRLQLCLPVSLRNGRSDPAKPAGLNQDIFLNRTAGVGLSKDVCCGMCALRSNVVFVQLSKDVLLDSLRERIYGRPVMMQEKGWRLLDEANYLAGISQEHGVLKVTEEVYGTIDIGDCIGILPVHSCMTADLMKQYLSLENIWINKMY